MRLGADKAATELWWRCHTQHGTWPSREKQGETQKVGFLDLPIAMPSLSPLHLEQRVMEMTKGRVWLLGELKEIGLPVTTCQKVMRSK